MKTEILKLKKIFVPDSVARDRSAVVVRRGPGGMGPEFVAVSGGALIQDLASIGKRTVLAKIK